MLILITENIMPFIQKLREDKIKIVLESQLYCLLLLLLYLNADLCVKQSNLVNKSRHISKDLNDSGFKISGYSQKMKFN